MKLLHPEFGRYLAVGGLCWVADTAVYWVVLQRGGHFLLAALMGFLAGVCLSYALSVRWVFAHRRCHHKGAEFFLFLVTGGTGLLLTAVMLWVLIEGLKVSPLPAKVVTTVLVLGANYGMRKKMLFSAVEQGPAIQLGKP